MSHQPVQATDHNGVFVHCPRCTLRTLSFADNAIAWASWQKTNTVNPLPCIGDPMPANVVAVSLRDMNAAPIISTVEKYRRAITAKAIALDECRERLRDRVMIGNPDMITAECKAWLRAVDELENARAVLWEHCNDR